MNFKENTEYRLEAMENKGYVIAFSYAGCEERDEDGYGMEECYNFQAFDEFFHELWKVDGYSYREFEIAGNPSTGNAKVNWPGKKRRGPYTGETERKRIVSVDQNRKEERYGAGNFTEKEGICSRRIPI